MKTTRDFYDKTAQQWWNRCAGDTVCLQELPPEPGAVWRKHLFLRC